MKTIITILFSVFSVTAFAQKVDTVEFRYSKYQFAKQEETRKYNRKFYIYKLGYNVLKFNGKDSVYETVFEEVPQEEYDAHNKLEERFFNCTSCWVKYYNENGSLFTEGFYAGPECLAGEFRTYYNKTGKLKTLSHWRLLNEAEKSIFKNRCSIRTGEWIYFKPDGSKEKIEKYKDDILIETIQF